jgi:hypothetical protein
MAAMDPQTMMIVSKASQIAEALDEDPDNWSSHLVWIRTITKGAVGSLRNRGMDLYSQILVIKTFQRVAYMEPDTGGLTDISTWCLNNALELLQDHPQDVELLALIGRNWLYRAQPALSRIHQAEQESPSSSGSIGVALSTNEEERKAEIAREDDRLETRDYVDARGTLYAAGEKFEQALSIAKSKPNPPLTAELLTTAAEAFMSLGNVTSLRENRVYYRMALDALRDAAKLPNYTLPSHLQQYLDEYGPLDEAT